MIDLGNHGTLLLDTFLKVTLLLALAGGASLWLRRASAATRSVLWSATLAGLLTVPLATFWLPAWDVAVPAAFGSWSPRQEHVKVVRILPETAVSDEALSDAARRSESRSAEAWTTVLTWLRSLRSGVDVGLALWLGGSALLLLRLLASYVRAHRWVGRAEPLKTPAWRRLLQAETDRLGLRAGVTLLSSGRVGSPMVFGLLRPRLVLPLEAAGWSPERRRLVLRHELAHVERRDCLVQLLVQLASCLHWFNPAVWLAAWRYTLERERACDDRVLALGARPADYASHLLDIARARSSHALPAVAMARPSQLEGRLLAILDGGRRRGVSGRVRAVLAAAVPLACVALALVHPVVAQEEGQVLEGQLPVRVVLTLDETEVEGVLTEVDAESLIADLSSPEPEERRRAAQALGHMRDERAFEPLLEALGDPYREVRKDAAEALGRLGDRRAVPRLLELLADGHWEVRHLAALALGELGDRRAVEELIFLLRDPAAGVREQAAMALGKLHDARAVHPLIALCTDDDWQVREKAAFSLGILGRAAAVDPLIDLLTDEEWQVREKAVIALGMLADARGVEPLVARLADEHWQVRDGVAHALGALGAHAAVEALRRALDDPSSEVRASAARALEQIEGFQSLDWEDVGPDSRSWTWDVSARDLRTVTMRTPAHTDAGAVAGQIEGRGLLSDSATVRIDVETSTLNLREVPVRIEALLVEVDTPDTPEDDPDP